MIIILFTEVIKVSVTILLFQFCKYCVTPVILSNETVVNLVLLTHYADVTLQHHISDKSISNMKAQVKLPDEYIMEIMLLSIIWRYQKQCRNGEAFYL